MVILYERVHRYSPNVHHVGECNFFSSQIHVHVFIKDITDDLDAKFHVYQPVCY
jgi:hypothetical protein